MKLTVKFDKKTIQGFLLENVEKVVLGAVVFVFLVMLYFALTGAGRFDRTPGQLLEQVRRGEDDLKTTPANSAGLVVPDYAGQAKQSRADIEEKPYGYTVLWDAPVFTRRPPRDAPPLFAVQQLRGAAEVGAFRMAVAPAAGVKLGQPARPRRPGAAPPAAPAAQATGGEDVRGQRWVVITGLVPVEKQEAAYAETFKPSVFYDSQKDYPAYLGYWVERVEVASVGEKANPNWEKATKFMSKEAIEQAAGEWPQSRDVEVVAQEYIEDRLVFPLGPLVNRTWGPEVAHEPEIPLKRSDERGAGMDMGERGRMMERPRSERGPGPGPVREGRGRESPDDDTPFGEKTEEPVAAEPATKVPAKTDKPVEESKASAYKLFRFFDFSVEPGKQYVYRVCLALQNPNRDLKPALLAKPELATEKFLKTKWSDPTSVISVPRDARILALSVIPPRPNVDPSSKILVVRWVRSKGIEAFVEKAKVGRGQVADFSGEKFRSASVARQMRLEGRNPGFTTPSRELMVDFITGITVVDFRGGEHLPGRRGSTLISAGEILLLDPDGTLSVRNELDDTPAYEQLTNAGTEPSAEEAGGPGFMGPPPGGGHPRHGLDEIPEDPSRRRPPTRGGR